jgi:hypothetical protein
MKLVAAVAGLLVGLLLVGAAGMWLAPRLRPATQTLAAPAGVVPDRSSGMPAPATRDPATPLRTPRSEDQRLRDAVTRQRIPFYRFLHDQFADSIEHAAEMTDVETIDLVVRKADNETILHIVQQALAPRARQYGFERARFYVRNPRGSADPYTVVAEASHDGSGRWNTFWK